MVLQIVVHTSHEADSGTAAAGGDASACDRPPGRSDGMPPPHDSSSASENLSIAFHKVSLASG